MLSSITPLISLLLGGIDPVEDAIRRFEGNAGPSRFVKLGSDPAAVRTEYAGRLRALAANPRLLNQKAMNACGTAAFLFIWLRNNRRDAIQYAIDLFEKGCAQIGTLTIAPNEELLRQDYAFFKREVPEAIPEMVDWVMMSALRNGTQAGPIRFLGTLKEGLSAIVMPHEFAEWLQATGNYRVVSNQGNILIQQHLPIWRNLRPRDTDVAVLTHTRLLTDTTDVTRGECRQEAQDLGQELLELATPNHYVVLDEKIVPTGSNKLRFSFWCWGDELAAKNCFPYEFNQTRFEDNFYGAVIGVK
jgi:hypothetical protein